MDEEDDTSSVLHVAALIGDTSASLGVLTVYKPQADVLPIIRRRVSEIWWGTGLGRRRNFVLRVGRLYLAIPTDQQAHRIRPRH